MAASRTLVDVSDYALPPDAVVFGRTKRMLDIQARIERLANINIPVLITGPSGTGKEIISRMLHSRSPWREGPFVKINCPAIPGTLLESELFGYERGAFTGAFGNKPGRVEMANRGTLFLDEIGEMELSLQSKLLQLLQDGSFCRIGAHKDQKIEVRVLCATNRDLNAEVEAGTFRQDLYYRINVLSVQLPALADRRDDIPMLIEYFIGVYSKQYGHNVRPLSRRTMKTLENYHWPGNIREVENLIKRYTIFGSEDVVIAALQVPAMGPYGVPLDDGPVSLKAMTRQAMKHFEKDLLVQALTANCWNRKKTAKQLNISYRGLLYKLKDAGINSHKHEPAVVQEIGFAEPDLQD